MTPKKLEIGEGVMAVVHDDCIRLVCVPDAIIKAAVSVIEARYGGGEWEELKNAIGELEEALARAGYDGKTK